MRFLGIIVAGALSLASPVLAAGDEDTMVIEVAGENTGVIEIELLDDVAPNHVAQIKRLVREGKYDEVVFHRVIDGFMAQTGDVEHGRREGFDLRYAGTGGSDFPRLEIGVFRYPLYQRRGGHGAFQQPPFCEFAVLHHV